MNSVAGHIGVWLGLMAALAGVAVIGAGLVRHRPDLLRSGRVYALLLAAGALVATAAMEHALVTHDFSLAYVAANNSRHTPLLYTVTGMWSALAGSILLWGLILAGYVVAVTWRFRRRADDPLVGWATLVCLAVAAFFFGLMAGPADPFRTVAGPPPADGLGPNVLLQDNPLVAFHPPMLYLGFVGFTVPFAFAVASLVTGRLGEGWQLATRRFTLFAWGGFWAWDPVENASFVPWLCATAYLHSVLVQERRGLLRVWNLSLVIATFSLTILATFLTRSGVIESVHAFSDSDIGPLLIGFFAVVVATGIGLIAWRGDRLRSPGGIDAPLSREGAFLLNNLLFVAFAFIVLLGTVFPLLVEALRGQQVTVGRPYFDTMTVPIGLALLLLMAVGPALPWRKTTLGTLGDRLLVPAWAGAAVLAGCVAGGVRGLAPLVAFGLGGFAAAANVRQLALAARAAHRQGVGAWRGLVGRANGGMVVHLGVVVIGVGLAAATSFGHRGELTLAPGASARFDGHVVAYRGLLHTQGPASHATVARVVVDGGRVLRPAVTWFGHSADPVGTPAIGSGPLDDVYLTIDALPASATAPITVGVIVQPLVSWLWAGGAIVVAGAVLAAVPGRRRRPTDPVSAPVPALAATAAAGDGATVAAPAHEPVGAGLQ